MPKRPRSRVEASLSFGMLSSWPVSSISVGPNVYHDAFVIGRQNDRQRAPHLTANSMNNRYFAESMARRALSRHSIALARWDAIGFIAACKIHSVTKGSKFAASFCERHARLNWPTSKTGHAGQELRSQAWFLFRPQV